MTRKSYGRMRAAFLERQGIERRRVIPQPGSLTSLPSRSGAGVSEMASSRGGGAGGLAFLNSKERQVFTAFCDAWYEATRCYPISRIQQPGILLYATNPKSRRLPL
ncbi:hypothetical protein X011_08005 [Mycobacterium tuberculosis variant microti OV254]|nr:hypothetical protein X011_08005 [Mycobacterium tuberculosis variant microti OV254]BBX39268.1 hypothetical protein MSIM_07190 [Mycobacterium simiae]